jgi:hypothetical protein
MAFYRALPHETQLAVAKDWITRKRVGWIRGTGIATHALYLDMIAQEMDVTIDEVAAMESLPS